VNANLKADTTDELLGRKRNMHMTAFRYRLDEIADRLKVSFLKRRGEGYGPKGNQQLR
jgi:hypothetical protein